MQAQRLTADGGERLEAERALVGPLLGVGLVLPEVVSPQQRQRPAVLVADRTRLPEHVHLHRRVCAEATNSALHCGILTQRGALWDSDTTQCIVGLSQ